jgi:hypothetical protein
MPCIEAVGSELRTQFYRSTAFVLLSVSLYQSVGMTIRHDSMNTSENWFLGQWSLLKDEKQLLDWDDGFIALKQHPWLTRTLTIFEYLLGPCNYQLLG